MPTMPKFIGCGGDVPKLKMTTKGLLRIIQELRQQLTQIQDKMDELEWQIQLEGVKEDRPKSTRREKDIPF